MDFVMFGGFHHRVPQEAPLPVDWDAQEKSSKYNDTQADELGLIDISTATEPENSVIAEHQSDNDPLNREEGFNRAQAVTGRVGEAKIANLSKGTKVLIGAIATITFGFGGGFACGYLTPDEGSIDTSKLCEEQSGNSSPNAVAIFLGNCDPNQNPKP